MHARSQLGAAFVVAVGILRMLRGIGATAGGPAFGQTNAPVERRRDADHRYRIIGKVRLLFFWVSADDVGRARITWRGGERVESVSLLIGSEPQRAPRGVNEWGYIREDVAGDSTTVFGIRTVTDGDSPDDAEARRTRPGGLAELGVPCSTVSLLDTMSRTTTVYVARDVTYRGVAHVLDVVEESAHWKGRRTIRPGNAAPGFLTALDLMMRSSAVSALEAERMPVCPRLAYVYKDAVYDLIPRRVERVPQLRTQSGLFRNLLRGDIVVRNRVTGSTTDFSIIYGTDGALF